MNNNNNNKNPRLLEPLQIAKKVEEAAAKLAINELLDSFKKESLNFYKDYLLNREEYRAGAVAMNGSHKRRLCKSRKARFNAKKASKLNLFRGFPGSR
jgi:hypothetical protein